MANGRIASPERRAALMPRAPLLSVAHVPMGKPVSSPHCVPGRSIPGPPLPTIACRRAILDFSSCRLVGLGGEPVRLTRRRRLISRRRRCQVFSCGLASELADLTLVFEGREHTAEEALGAEFRGSHRLPALLNGRCPLGG